MRRPLHSALALLLGLAGCAGGSDLTTGFETLAGTTTTTGAGTTDPEPTTAGTTGTTTTTTTTGPTTTGPEPTSTTTTSAGSTGGPEVVPCTAIDFLFVVDNSSTMAEEQLRLGAAAPDFIAAVREKLPDVAGIHVGVITSDTPAIGASAAMCGPYAGGLDFMTEADDLGSALACAAKVGVDGNPDERPLEMLIAAIDDLANQPGGLNADFVRKPALLVIVLVADEEDDHEEDLAWGSEGDPPQWFSAVTAVKDGLAQDFVVLALVGTPEPNGCPPFQWDGEEGAELAPRLAEFAGMFPFGRVGDVCAPSYDGFFFDAVPAVADACAGFVPVE